MLQQVNHTFQGKLLTPENIQKLRSFGKLKRPHQDKHHLNPELDHYSLDNPQPNISSYHLPESQMSDYDETQYSHALQSNYFSETKTVSLNDLQRAANKPMGKVFLHALLMAQKGEVRLTQENPETFSTIYVQKLEKQ